MAFFIILMWAKKHLKLIHCSKSIIWDMPPKIDFNSDNGVKNIYDQTLNRVDKQKSSKFT